MPINKETKPNQTKQPFFRTESYSSPQQVLQLSYSKSSHQGKIGVEKKTSKKTDMNKTDQNFK